MKVARKQLGVRLHPRLHAQMTESAKRNGVSLNAEIEARLTWTVERGRLLAEVLEAAKQGGVLSAWATDLEESVSP